MATGVESELNVPSNKSVPSTIPTHCVLDMYPHRELINIVQEDSFTDHFFEIISYNLLAQCYIFKSRYPHTKDFSQQFRHGNLIEEIKHIGPGAVVCYQEVTSKYFSSLLEPAMGELGYYGVFQGKSTKKPGGVPSKDGLAIFHKHDEVIPLGVYPLVLNELLHELWTELYGPESDLPSECYRDTISLVSVFSIKGEVIVVGNIHLPWTKVYWDVQCLQVCLVLKKMAELAKKHNSNAYILCGDFNSKPGREIYHLITHGELDTLMHTHFLNSDMRVHIPLVQCAPKNETLENFLPYYRVFEKYYALPEPLKSAYLTRMGKEPQYTFFADSQGCMDYIFYNSGLEVKSVLDIPSLEAVSSETSLPNNVMPSDHISIKAAFRCIVPPEANSDK